MTLMRAFQAFLWKEVPFFCKKRSNYARIGWGYLKNTSIDSNFIITLLLLKKVEQSDRIQEYGAH